MKELFIYPTALALGVAVGLSAHRLQGLDPADFRLDEIEADLGKTSGLREAGAGFNPN